MIRSKASWHTLWLLLPPVYGLWLCRLAPRLRNRQRLFLFLAWGQVAATSLALVGCLGLAAVGISGAERLLAVLVRVPWLPLALLGVGVYGTLIPSAVCGYLAYRQLPHAGRRWWLWCLWPLGPQALD